MSRKLFLVVLMFSVFAFGLPAGTAQAVDPTVCATATATQEPGLETYLIVGTGYAQYARVVEYPVVDPENPVIVAGPQDFGPGATIWTFEHVVASETHQYQLQVSKNETAWLSFAGCVMTPPPLGVSLIDFNVTRYGLVGWETDNEIDIAGFFVWRGSVSSHGLRLVFVPAQHPGGVQGAIYSYQDSGMMIQRRPAYWLEVLTLDGVRLWFGPVQAE